MSGEVALRGSSWDHPRGHAPMLATSAEYGRLSGGKVALEWVPRSLGAFGTAAVEELAAEFDLILVDHPHVGAMARSGSVVPLDEWIDAPVLAELATGSPGRSHESYRYDGHQWALAVDAACQVAARRPDLLPEEPESWEDVVELAGGGRVLWPLGEIDAAASFLTLTALAGRPCGEGGPNRFADEDAGRWAIGVMAAVAERSDDRCLGMNPIDVLEAMTAGERYLYAPLLFGYVSYSRLERPEPRLAFGDVADAGNGRSGSILGGVGIAVSASSRAIAEAVGYARYVAAPATQRSLYFDAGGQPAHAAAWDDPEVDRRAGRFFSATRATIGGAWTRPRHPGFAAFQNEMIARFARWREAADDPSGLLEDLEALHRRHAPEHPGEG